MVGSMRRRAGILLVAGLAASAIFRPDSALATASSVADDAKAANVMVSSVTSGLSGGQTAGLISTSITNAITPTAPTLTTSLRGGSRTAGIGAPVSMADGHLVGSIFSSRAIASGKSAAAGSPALGAWVQGAYTWIDNNEAGGKFDGGVFNIVAGVDFKPAALEGSVVGVAVGWEDVEIETAFNVGTFDGSGITVAPYFGYAFTPNLSADLVLGYSNIDYDNVRTLGGRVTGNFEGDRFFGAANLNGTFFQDNFRIAPKVGILGLIENQDGYTDSTGAAIGSTTIHLGQANLGAEVGYTIDDGVEPFVSAKVAWDFNRNSPIMLTTGRMASDEEVSGTFGIGVNLTRGNFSGQLKGETNQFKNEISTWSVMGRIRADF